MDTKRQKKRLRNKNPSRIKAKMKLDPEEVEITDQQKDAIQRKITPAQESASAEIQRRLYKKGQVASRGK